MSHQGFADEALAAPVAVHLCRVDERHAARGAAAKRERLGVVRVAVVAHVQGALAKRCHLASVRKRDGAGRGSICAVMCACLQVCVCSREGAGLRPRRRSDAPASCERGVAVPGVPDGAPLRRGRGRHAGVRHARRHGPGHDGSRPVGDGPQRLPHHRRALHAAHAPVHEQHLVLRAHAARGRLLRPLRRAPSRSSSRPCS